jgi:tRNA (mo5U34)-methyltransferase
LNAAIQKRIDAVEWYHELDFGNGLVARPRQSAEDQRRHFAFVRSRLDRIDFCGKTVLDIGCWDGYWSFYAERRGAAHVLATHDAEQNWAGDTGLRLAKELLRSNVEIDTRLSVYDLTRLKKKFDIILCLGVYYHLIDPFYAFAQIRHCCHDHTVVVFEGAVSSVLPVRAGTSRAARYQHDTSTKPRFHPTPTALSGLLEAAYFTVINQAVMSWPRSGLRHRLKRAIRAFTATDREFIGSRIVVECHPFQGERRLFLYPPPFGLDRYDTRWAGEPERLR